MNAEGVLLSSMGVLSVFAAALIGSLDFRYTKKSDAWFFKWALIYLYVAVQLAILRDALARVP